MALTTDSSERSGRLQSVQSELGLERILSSCLQAESLLNIACFPHQGDYEAGRRVWNALIDRRPSAILRPRNTAEVSACLRVRARCTCPVSCWQLMHWQGLCRGKENNTCADYCAWRWTQRGGPVTVFVRPRADCKPGLRRPGRGSDDRPLRTARSQ